MKTSKCLLAASVFCLSAPAQTPLPTAVSFESEDGFAPGPLHGQESWIVDQGAASVVADESHDGDQSVLVAGGLPLGQIRLPISPGGAPPIIFTNFFVKVSANDPTANDEFVEVHGSVVALFDTGSALGEFFAFDGDGQGGGQYSSVGVSVDLDTNLQTQDWVQITIRQDFSQGRKSWDLYVNGKLAAADLGLIDNNATYPEAFIEFGHPTGESYLDDLYIGGENPLFPDSDYDGMDDQWELANGLSPSLDDRSADGDADGLSNIQEFQIQTRAYRSDTDGDGMSDGQEVANGLDPLDYYNGQPPSLQIVQGNNQTCLAGALQPVRSIVRVTNSAGEPLVNAPLLASVLSGNGALSRGPYSTGAATQLPLTTDTKGEASFNYLHPQQAALSTIEVAALAGNATTSMVTFNAESVVLALPEAARLVAWFKSNSGVMESDGQLSAWADQSGHENDAAQAEPSYRPTLAADALMGQAALQFDGVDDFLQMPEGSSANPSFSDFTNGLTAFVVARPEQYLASSRFLSLSRGGSSNVIALAIHKAYSYTEYSLDIEYLVDNLATPPQRPAALNALIDGRPQILSVAHAVPTGANSEGEVTLSVDGRIKASATAELPELPADHRTQNAIGKSSITGQPFFGGLLAEIILYNSALPPADRRKVEIYLSRKYGIPVAVEPPVLSPVSGAADPQAIDVTVSASESLPSGLTQFIRYTTDGSEPTWDSPGSLGDELSLQLQSSALVRARVFFDPQTYSSIAESVYFINDSDQDGMDDDWELSNGLDPNDSNDAALDSDNDGLTNLQEFILGSNIHKIDTNGDGIVDGVAARLGVDIATLDLDGDGLTNAEERLLGTNPALADTDGDGVPDGEDEFPLDPAIHELVADPGDTTPPTITILAPANANPL